MDAAEIAQLSRDEHDHVRESTAAPVNRRLDADALDRVTAHAFATPEEIDDRIGQLRQEWDIERVLEVNAAAIALSGLALGTTVSRRFLAVPAVVLSFLAQHAIQGWCPPIPVFRRLGVRTRKEIDREIVALKALRGDFDDVRRQPASEHAGQRARAAWEAAKV
jgi:hypothetical protein